MRSMPAWLLVIAFFAAGCKSTAPKAIQLEDITPVRAQRQEQAVAQFEKDRTEAQFQAALSHWEQGHLEDCEQLLAGIVKREPQHVAAGLLLAEVKLAVNQPDQAAEVLKRTLASRPATEQDRLSAAVLALRYNQPHLAVELLQAVQSGQAASPAALRTLGVACYRCGDYAAAEAALRRALVLDNTSALSYFLIGCTQSRLGHRSEAEAALEQAARLDTRFRAAHARSI
jgi:predicted Zn-dependent protease